MKTADFLNDYAAALLSYSAHEIAGFYQVPLTVYSDEGVLQVSQTIRTCKVLWNNFNTSGKKAGSETNFYILSETAEGLKIRGLIITTI